MTILQGYDCDNRFVPPKNRSFYLAFLGNGRCRKKTKIDMAQDMVSSSNRLPGPELHPDPDVDVVFFDSLEIACIKGKAIAWQPGVHTEVALDDFMASKDVFECYDKGVKAGEKALQSFEKKWGLIKISEIFVEILEKGQLEGAVKGLCRGDRSYEVCYRRDVANAIVQQTLDSASQFPFSVMLIDRLMTSAGYKPCYEFSIHHMASETITLLQKNDFPIQRAHLRLRMCVSPSWMTTLLKKLEGWNPLVIGSGFDFDTRLDKNRGFNAIEDIVAKLDEALDPLAYLMKFELEVLDPGYYTKCLNFVSGHHGELKIVEVVKIPDQAPSTISAA